MADNRKYYYLKINEYFFNNPDIKLLKKQPNGERHCLIYLELCLLSLKTGGKLRYKDSIPYNPEKLSIILDEDIDHIKCAVHTLCEMRLMEILDDDTIYMSDIETLIGSSTTEADRVAKYRREIKREKEKLKLAPAGEQEGINNFGAEEIKSGFENLKKTAFTKEAKTEAESNPDLFDNF